MIKRKFKLFNFYIAVQSGNQIYHKGTYLIPYQVSLMEFFSELSK